MLNDIYHNLNPVAFSIGPISVRWYGLAYLAGFIIAAFIIYRTAKRWKIRFTVDDLLTFMLCVIVGVLVGGRLGYCLFYGDGYYLAHPADIIKVSDGGMSFHGGLIGALIGGFIAAKSIKMPFFTLMDIAAVGTPIGLFFGRCANFVNGELWGAITDLPIGVVFGGSAGDVPRHPSQLYEAVLEGLVLFLILYLVSRKKRPAPRGFISGLFLVFYGIFRILVEFVRQPDAQIGYLWGDWLTMGMVLSVPFLLLGVAICIVSIMFKKPQEGTCPCYNDMQVKQNLGGTMLKFYKCKHCGNVVIQEVDGAGTLTCCGEAMEELIPNTVDAASEKHLPKVTVTDEGIDVVVGEVEHPMTEEHLINFIVFQKKCAHFVIPQDPGKPAHGFFGTKTPEKVEAVYAYCNLHGLWKTEL